MKQLCFILLASLGLVCLANGHTIGRSDGLRHSRVRRAITEKNFDNELDNVKKQVDAGINLDGIKETVGDLVDIVANSSVSTSLKAAKGIEAAAGLVAESISIAEEKIRENIAKLEVIAPKYKKQIDGVYEEYSDLIKNLEQTRLSLFGLADETIVKCKEYDSLIQDWEDYKDDQDYLLELMYTTKDLMERTIKAIDIAQDKYKESKSQLENLIRGLGTIRASAELEQTNVDSTAAYNSMWLNFGASFVKIIGSVAGQAANIVSKQERGQSISSDITATITSGISDIALTVGSLIKNKEDLAKMTDDFKSILDSVNDMTRTFQQTKETLQKESEILTIWEGRAGIVLDTMEEIGDLPKKKLGRIRIKMRKAAKVSMCELREAAEKWKQRQSIDFLKGILKSGDINCEYNKNQLKCSCS